jgi:hypothetical protein
MTRKDYELIARSIFVDRENLDPLGKNAADYITAGLARQLEAMNPRFDRHRFLEACGYGIDSDWRGSN